MSNFEDRLKKAVERGTAKRSEQQSEAASIQARKEEMRRLHTTYRLALSEKIDVVVRRLIDQFPGFQYSGVFGPNGWGGACTRDDLSIRAGKRESRYSRFEMAVRPVNDYLVLDLQAKGTVANREVLVRNFFQPLAEADIAKFHQLIEDWALSFAELYAASMR